MAGGDVYITGRVKDIIIRAGQHIYPQEIEEAISDIPGIRKGCVAVFGVTDQASGTERVVVLAETRATDTNARAALQSRAYQVATDIAGAPPDEIVLAPPRTVPKTSSGKIRRSAAKQMYETGRVGGRTAPVWCQLLRLASAGALARTAHVARLLAKLGYATWWWLVVSLSAPIGWLAVLILPNLAWRWAAVRALARATLAAIGAPLSVTGIERVPSANAMLVFNHSSYVDALVLAAVLPGEPTFVAKKELMQQFFARLALRRLGTLFVERYNVADSRADAQTVIAAARQGHVLVFFPEGTFTRRAGTRWILSWRFHGRRRSTPSGPARGDPGHAIDAAGRPMVPPVGFAQR